MTGHLKIHLKANERIFINGAVLKVDRRVSIDLLNEMAFLLDCHVLQQDQATTPLRQLYFVVQSMLIDPQSIPLSRQIYDQSHRALIATFRSLEILEGLVEVRRLIDSGKVFEALKRIRALYLIEADVLAPAGFIAPGRKNVA